MGNAITFRMPSGIPGAVNRVGQSTLVSEMLDANTPPTAYGVFTKYVNGKVQPIAAGDAAAVIIGLLARPFPLQMTQNDAIGAGTPDPTRHQNILKRGFMTVVMGFGVAAKGAQVYVSVNAAVNPVGSIGDNSDAAHCVAVTGAFFTGPADANGNVEIQYNL